MNRKTERISAVLALVILGPALALSQSKSVAPLELVRVIPMERVNGRIDHLAVDAVRNRLFVAALGNNSVEVIDLAAGKQAASIDRMPQAQGVWFLSAPPTLIATTGGDGKVRFFDDALKPIGAVESLPDADNLRFDAAGKRLYVGYGGGALSVIDVEKKVKVGDIEVGGHPESFQLEKTGRRIFVNVPRAGQVAVIDRDKGAVVATWPLGKMKENFPMALDEANHRLFVACRDPAKLLVIDTDTGKILAALDCCGDADDVFFDERRGRVVVSGGAGDGMICVFERRGAEYGLLFTAATAPGARTCVLAPDASRLYIAVPRRNQQKAEIREFQVRP